MNCLDQWERQWKVEQIEFTEFRQSSENDAWFRRLIQTIEPWPEDRAANY